MKYRARAGFKRVVRIFLGLAFALEAVLPAMAHAQTGQVLFTDSLAAWQAAAGTSLNTTAGYGASSTGLGTGTLTYSPGTVVIVGQTWNTWCCNYAGQAIWTNGSTSTTLSFSGGITAFGVQIEPDIYQVESMTVTLSNGQSITEDVGGEAGAQFIGFAGSGITSLVISDGAGDDFAFGNFYSVAAQDSVVINSADLVSNAISVTLSGSSTDTGVLTILLNGASGTYTETASNGTAVGPGTYNISLTRTSIPIDSYSSVTATWAVPTSTPSPSMTFNLPESWEVLGVIRHSVYNVPTESSCSGTSTSVWIVNSSCTFTQAMLDSSFIKQTQLNGTGASISYGLIKPAGITIEPSLCKGKAPKGSNNLNSFYQVSSVTGSCNTTLVPGASVATYPNPSSAESPSPICGDSILIVQPTQANLAVKKVGDYCPACSMDFRGANGHIDNFSSNQSCTARSSNDLGNFWTTDTQGESQ